MNPEYVPEWEQILGIPVNDFFPFRRIVRLITPAGDWVVKPVRDPVQLRWWMSVDRELRFRGFRSMPPIYTDGSRWLITPMIDGFPVSYRDRNQVRKAARLLALFHRLGRGLATPPFHRKRHPFLHRLDARLSEFARLLKTCEGMEGEIGELIRQYGRQYYRYGMEARKQIAEYPLSLLFEREWRGAVLLFIRIWPVTIGSWTGGETSGSSILKRRITTGSWATCGSCFPGCCRNKTGTALFGTR